MTTIAWDGTRLAADRRAVNGGLISIVTKIHEAGACLVGLSGDAAFHGELVEWVKNGRDVAKFPAAQRTSDWQPGLVIEPDGRPALYEQTPYPVRYLQRHVAIGSGRDFARAAMLLGKTAAESVWVASQLDAGTGKGIDLLTRTGEAAFYAGQP